MTTGALVGLLVLAAVCVGRPSSAAALARLVQPPPLPFGRAPRRSSRPGVAASPGGRRGHPRLDAALLLDLSAAALEAGAAPLAALEAAAAALAEAQPGPEDEELRRRCTLLRLGASWEEAWDGVPRGLEPLRAPLALALRAGAPGAGLLRDAATELRRRRAREAQRRAQALGVRLVVPLGACALPAFAAVAVVPVVLSLAQGVLDGGG